MLVYEIGESTEIFRATVVEIEEAMNTIKDKFVDELKKEASTTKKCIKKNYRKNYISKKIN